MASELKPCPFCGGKPTLDKNDTTGSIIRNNGITYDVSCRACCAYIGKLFTSEQEAISAWNTRDVNELVNRTLKRLTGILVYALNDISEDDNNGDN